MSLEGEIGLDDTHLPQQERDITLPPRLCSCSDHLFHLLNSEVSTTLPSVIVQASFLFFVAHFFLPIFLTFLRSFSLSFIFFQKVRISSFWLLTWIHNGFDYWYLARERKPWFWKEFSRKKPAGKGSTPCPIGRSKVFISPNTSSGSVISSALATWIETCWWKSCYRIRFPLNWHCSNQKLITNSRKVELNKLTSVSLSPSLTKMLGFLWHLL